MSDILVFDIETIPQRVPLSFIQQEELDKKLDKITDNIEKLKQKNMLMATSAYMGEIICIGLLLVRGDKYDTMLLTGNEQVILKNFWNELQKFNGLFVSFNGKIFDQPFIVKRSMKYGILPTNNSFLDVNIYNNTPHFDVRLALSNNDKFAIGSLRTVCEFLNIASPKEGDIKAENVADAFENGQINEIAKYCERDIEATLKVYHTVRKYMHTKTNKY